MTVSAKSKTQPASGRKDGMMAKRWVRGVLKTAAEVVGPSGTSDVGLLSNKTVQTEGLERQGYLTGTT